MKFGKTFLGHQVPEWTHSYMNYKALKKQVKVIATKQHELISKNTEIAITDSLNDAEIKGELASFFFDLDRNIERVDDFYNKQYSEYERRLKKIGVIFGPSNKAEQTIQFDDDEEADEVLGILLELRNSFRNLKWFGELNRRGFRKILKKLDKKVGTKSQDTFMSARIYPLPFANESEITKNLTLINNYLNRLFPNQKISENTDNSTLTSLNLNSSVNSSVSNIDNIPTNPVTKNKSNPTLADMYMEYINKDDKDELNQALIKDFMSPVLAPLKLLLSLLNKATLCLSYKCIDALLEIIPVLSDSSDISGRNFIHHHVIALGKQYAKQTELLNQLSNFTDRSIEAATPPDLNMRLVGAFGPDGINSNDSSQGLLYIFENLPPHLKFAILQKDNYKRTPLHYAAQYGLKEVTSIIIDFLKKWSLWNDKISIDDIGYWGDSELFTPIHLSILGTHPLTTKVLLNSMSTGVTMTCPQLLFLATRLNSTEIIGSLLEFNGIDINYFDLENRETCLYIASKLNLVDSVELLLSRGANTELGEATFGWTPIFIAASEGYMEVVKALLAHNAKFDIQDESGWYPREHACLRGHLDITALLTPKDYNPYQSLKVQNLKSPRFTPQAVENIDELKEDILLSTATSIDRLSERDRADPKKAAYKEIRRHTGVSGTSREQNNRYARSSSPAPAKPVKSFGHRYLNSDESLILITLGTTDLRDTKPAIELNRVPLSRAHNTELDTALSIVISSKNLADQPPVMLDLPLDDNHGGATDPITFKCVNNDPLDTIIYFDIVPTYQYNGGQSSVNISELINNNTGSSVRSQQKVLGRAVALLRSVYTEVGNNRQSLSSIITLPILESNTLEVLGSVRFEFMLVRPFSHPQMSLSRTDTYWKSLVSSRVIGHRGNGMNSRDRRSLQLGENTVESFIAAASLGASYVEFDVQLTKDDVPVVYHDFLVAESGIDVPMHALTLEQFMGLNKSEDNISRGEENSNHVGYKNSGTHSGGAISPSGGSNIRPRSASLTRLSSYFKDSNDVDEFSKSNKFSEENERMRFTKTWKLKQYKGNSRGSSIASNFVTLVELFKKVPKNVGFNIECKYPMADEAEEEDMGQIAPNMNHWVDTILKVVYENGNDRDIVFSSFHPDICVLLSLKQPSIPILFLTESGTHQMADVRASSLQNAIRFAKKWNLLGIVSAAEPIIECPRLASVVKATGLVCFTYGTLNNNPENAKLQMEAGVDAVIVDSVLAVRKGLTKEIESSSPSSASPQTPISPIP